MAEEKHQYEQGQEQEIQDRGMFDFLGKKKDEENRVQLQEEEVIATEMEKVHVSEPKRTEEPKQEEEEEKKHESLLEKLHRSGSSSSSVSSHLFLSLSLCVMF